MTNDNSKQIDVLSIGDTVVEPFIKLEKAEVHCGIDTVGCTITLPFGAKIPYESATVCAGVGNAANASVSFARLGLKSAIATELGDDDNGKLCLKNFTDNNVDIGPTNLHAGIPTNYHYVLWYPPERTILIKHNSYPKKIVDEKFAPNGIAPKYIYFSGLPADSLNYHFELIEWLKKNRHTKLVFQPGTFQMKLGVEALKPLYNMCNIFVVNKEESQYILNTKESEMQKLLEMTSKLGPEIVCITDGPAGAYLRYENKNYFMPIYPDPKPPLEAMRYAPVNSMNVVQEIGAQKGLLTMAEIESWLEKAPTDYKLVEI